MANKKSDAAAPAAPAAPAADTPATEAAKPKKEAKPKVERITQNGQTKPADGTVTGRLWAIIDEISAKEQRPATRKEVLERAEAEGFNMAMSASLYSHWRKFHGLVGQNAPGRTPKAEGEATPPAPPAPPAPAAEEVQEG